MSGGYCGGRTATSFPCCSLVKKTVLADMETPGRYFDNTSFGKPASHFRQTRFPDDLGLELTIRKIHHKCDVPGVTADSG
jgi:hypothetical protein